MATIDWKEGFKRLQAHTKPIFVLGLDSTPDAVCDWLRDETQWGWNYFFVGAMESIALLEGTVLRPTADWPHHKLVILGEKTILKQRPDLGEEFVDTFVRPLGILIGIEVRPEPQGGIAVLGWAEAYQGLKAVVDTLRNRVREVFHAEDLMSADTHEWEQAADPTEATTPTEQQTKLAQPAAEQPAQTTAQADTIPAALKDVAKMREYHPDYSLETALEIARALPKARQLWEDGTRESRWKSSSVASCAGLTPETVSRYLSAWRKAGIKEVGGVPIPQAYGTSAD